MKQKSAKLSNAIRPEHYDLFFEPDLKKFTFQGKAMIKVNIRQKTSEITLHAKELKIKKCFLICNSTKVKPRIKLNEKEETISLKLNKRVSGQALLTFEFKGILNNTLAGFYRSKYLHNNKHKYLAATQFEAPYARKAFPCFDQPNLKATFGVNLKIPEKMDAISNMPIQSETKSGSKKLITFRKTPLMSTYLLCMAVGNFEFIEDKLNNILIRIVTTPGKSSEGKFALDLTKKFLKYFENYSGIPYPLPKLDLIAIPDFAAGAMENWGAITFREILLLFDPEKTSTHIKKRIAEVIAHELWHQWSGNLVTMEWWDDLWLNESFATYMAYKAVDYYFPEWNMWEDFVNEETESAFREDSLKSTHPIEVKVNGPNQIEEIFDGISYGKGGSVLRMIESYLGEENFRKGISDYLRKYQYKNATSLDLWDSFARTSSGRIKEIMASWISQKGHPILEVEQNNREIIIKQKRFSQSPIKDSALWKIPLTIKTNTQTIRKLLEEKKYKITVSPNTTWIKINEDQKGFYRTKYTKFHLEELKRILEKNQLSVFDRWGIQKDLFDITKANMSTLNTYLDFISSYRNEENPFVLESIYGNLSEMYFIFSQHTSWEKIWPKLRMHIKHPFQKNLKRLTWNPKDGESQEDAILRALCISFLVFAEDSEIIKTGMSKFNDLVQNSKTIHPDLKGPIYALAAKNGDKKTYQQLSSLYESSEIPEEKVKLLAAMSKFRDKKILEEYLDYSLTDKVRIQDLKTAFSTPMANPYFRPILFSWTKANWRKLEKLKNTHFVFMTFLESLITSYTGRENKSKIKSFLDAKKIEYEKTKANAFEILDINTSWFDKNAGVLEDYFNSRLI